MIHHHINIYIIWALFLEPEETHMMCMYLNLDSWHQLASKGNIHLCLEESV